MHATLPKPRTALPGGKWRWLAGFLVLAALVAIFSARVEERRFAVVLERAQPAWLLAIVLLQIVTYGCLVRVWSKVIRRVDAKSPSAASLVSLALAELFTDQALPSGGVGGTIFVVSALDRRGCSRAAAGAAVTVSLFGLYIAQLVAVAASLLVLLVEHRRGAVTTSVGMVALVAAIVTPIVTVTVAVGGIDRIPARLRRFKFVETLRSAIESAPHDIIFDRRILARAAVWRLLILVLDGATLAAALAAIGHPLAIQDSVVVFVVASVAASVSFLPGGLGSYEALSIALLVALGVPLEAAAPATLLMRGFSFWLPMLPGLWFARRELAARAIRAPRSGVAIGR
jgi:glycosyltransferase 2 family protein